MSTMEEMIKQWEVFHQSIETRIDERVVRHVDAKLSTILLDPSCVVLSCCHQIICTACHVGDRAIGFCCRGAACVKSRFAFSDRMKNQPIRQRDHAVNVIHALSPAAEYHHLLTRLDMKVDKMHFQTFSGEPIICCAMLFAGCG